MSSTVDQKVVEMRFDNKQFESKANESISTIGKLKKALNFSDSTSSFDNLQKAADGVNMSKLGESVEGVKVKFSALQVVAATALGNIVNKAMNVGSQLVRSLGLDSITSGFQEYEMKMGSIQTILANTQSGTAEVSKEALDSVNVTAEKAVQKSEELNAKLLSNAQAAHEQQLEVFEEAAQAELKAYEKSAQAQLKAFDKRARAEQKAQSKAAQKEMETLEKNQQKKLKELQEELSEEQEALQKSYDARIEALEEEQDEEMELFRENHNEKLKLYKEEYMQQLKAADEDRYNQIKAIEDQIDAINGLTEAEEKERKASQQQEMLSSLQRNVDIAKNSAARRKAEKELADYQAEIARDQLLEDRKNQIEQLEAQKDTINDAFEEKKDKLQEEYELRQEQEDKLYKEELKALQEQQKEKREALQESYKEELKALQEQQDKRIEALQDQQKREREALSERIEAEQEALSERQQNEREALNDQIEQNKEAITKRQAAERKALQERQEEELKAIQARHEKELENIEEEKDAKVKALQATSGKTKGTSLEEVNKALDELNTYADKTIYNFAEMTRNIGTFTAAGVDLDTSVNAIKGIANLAALSGSSAQQASTAMYQLSQAIAAGKVNLMDWNSVVNAGIGGKVFKDSLKETARVHGVAVDEMIAKAGSFRESIQEGWITSDILLETLSKFTGDLSKEQLKSMGYTDEQIKGIVKMGKTAVGAATEVKTFSQLLSSLSESAGSGWASTFEIIFGNFEEAKSLWTSMYKTMDQLIGSQTKARNELLQSWKDLGGRQAIVDGLTNAWKALVAIAKPIKEAFRDVFPPATAEGLVKLSEGFRDLTEKMIISEETSDTLRKVFTVLFSAVKVLLDAISALFSIFKTGVSIIAQAASYALDFVKAVVRLGSALAGTIANTEQFKNAMQAVRDIFESFKDAFVKGGENIRNAMSSLSGSFSNTSIDLAGIAAALAGALSKIVSAFGVFGQAIVESVRAGDLERAVNIVKGVVGSLLGINLAGLVRSFKKFMDKGITKSLQDLKVALVDTFSAIQQQLKAKAIKDIAESIALLVASLVVLSLIKPEKLDAALGSIMILFAGLMGSMKLFDMMSFNSTFGSIGKIGAAMVGFGASLLILSGALKVVSTIDPKAIDDSLKAIGMLAAQMTGCIFALQMASDEFDEGKIRGLIPFAVAMGILVLELKVVSATDVNKLNVGLKAMERLAELMGSVIVVLQVASSKFNQGKISGLISFAISMGLLVVELEVVAHMDPKKLATGLLGLLGLAGIILTVLGVLTAINGKVKNASLMESAASVLVMAAAILVLAPALKLLATMDLGDIARALGVLAGAFTIIGVAGLLLTPIAPVIYTLGIAIKNLGIAALAAGVGVNLLAVGLPLLAVAGAASVTGLLLALSELVIGLLTIVRDSSKVFAEAGVAFIDAICEVVMTSSQRIAEAFLKVIDDSLTALVKYLPSIVDKLLELIIIILDGLSAKMPQLVNSVVNLFVQFFASITDAVAGIATDSLEKALIGVGVLAALMAAFAGLSLLTSAALSGVLGFGEFVAALAIVIAAAGALSKIPGVNWLLESGGEFLHKVGEAIGKFVGGILGSFMSSLTSHLPEVAMSLSMFMMNLQPFLIGCKMIDPSLVKSVGALAESILILTAAELLNGLTRWITGGTSLSDFGAELAVFGASFQVYYQEVKNIDGKVVEASANAAESLSRMAKSLPNQGGILSWFVGDNTLSMFGQELVKFGPYISKYANQVKDLKPEVVEASARAAQSLARMANNLPNQGGILAWFTGDNSLSVFGQELSKFGPHIAKYANQVKDLKPESVEASVQAAKMLSKMAGNLPNQGGVVSWFTGDNTLSVFGQELSKFGPYIAKYSKQVKDIDPNAVTASVNAAKAIAGLAENLPNQGGVLSWFSGDNDLGTFGANLRKFGSAISDYYDSVSGINLSALSAVVKEVRKLVNIARDVAEIDTSGMSKFGANLKKMGQNGIDEFLKAFKDSEKKVKESAKSLADKMVNGLKKGLPASTLKEIGKTAGTNINAGLNKCVPTVNKTAKSVASAITNTIKNNLTYRNFYNIGQNVGNGLANGISSRINDIANAAIAASAAAVNNARYTLGVYSPSRVFHGIGEYVSIGLANGIADKISAVAQAGKDLAQGTIDPVQMALSHISDIVENEEMDMNPCIVPSIDLSQVVDGVSRISSMFGGFDLAPTLALAQGAYTSFGQPTTTDQQTNEETNKVLSDKLDKLIDVTSDEARTENYNNFYITSTDPEQAAEEVGRVLQRKVERGRAAWGR